MSKKLTIDEMRVIAQSHGGECISKEYINAKRKLRWECSEGHEWEATPSNVKRGHWCPHCAGNAKSTIEEMRIIAKSRGGECLSDKYVNSHTKLKWRCSEGHEWNAVPCSVKGGTWCPYCVGRKK